MMRTPVSAKTSPHTNHDDSQTAPHDEASIQPRNSSSGKMQSSPPLRPAASSHDALSEAPLAASSASASASNSTAALGPDDAEAKKSADRARFEAMLLAAEAAERANPAPLSKNAMAAKRRADAAASKRATEAASEAAADAQPAGSSETAAPTSATATGAIEDRIVSKDWKARVSAYEEMKQELEQVEDSSTEDAAATINKYSPFLSKMMNDSSAPALDKAVDAVYTFLDKASSEHRATSYASDIVNAIVSKCSSAKPATKAKCDDIILLLIELGASDTVFAPLFNSIDNKNPKIPVLCAEAINKALQAFGPSIIDSAVLAHYIGKWYDSSNAKLKEQAADVCCTLYSYKAADLKLDRFNLKPTVEKDLNEKFQSVETGRKPTRTLRNGAAGGSGSAGGKGGKGGKAAAFDPLANAPAVDILAKLSKNWCDAVVNEEKWQDRQEKLRELSRLIKDTKKIQINPNMSDVTSSLKKALKQVNAAVQLESIKCVAAFCKGARKAYAPHAKQLYPLILPLLKEKAMSFKATLNPSLDTIYQCTLDFSDCTDTILEVLADKVALTRLNTCDYLVRCLKDEKTNAKSLPIDTVAKPLGVALLKACNDADNQVREAAVQPTALLISIVGKKVFTDDLNKFKSSEPKKYDKLEKAIDALLNGNAAAPSPASSTAEASPAAKDTASSTATSAPRAKPSIASSKPKPSLGAAAASATSTSSSSTTATSSKPSAAGKKSVAGCAASANSGFK